MLNYYDTAIDQVVINANNPTPPEQKYLIEHYGVSQEVMRYALDKFERPRISYDEVTQSYLMVISVPFQQTTLERIVQSVTIFVNKQVLVCFTSPECQYVMPHIIQISKNNKNASQSPIFEIFAELVRIISDNFLELVKQFYDEQERIELRFHQRKHRSQTINDLADLQTRITFGVAATSGNDDLIDEIYSLIDEDDNDFELSANLEKRLELAEIEANQAEKNLQLINEIVQQLSGTYNNLLNNETNDVMRYLTVYSLILTIPTIVGGFYGMNVRLPLANTSWSWLLIIIITVILIVIMVLDMLRRHFL